MDLAFLHSLFTHWIIPICIICVIFGVFIRACYRFYNTAPLHTCEEVNKAVANAIYPHLPKNLCVLVAQFTVEVQCVTTNTIIQCVTRNTIGRLHFSHMDMIFNSANNGGWHGGFEILPINDPTEIRFYQLVRSFIIRHTSNRGPDFRVDCHYINHGNGDEYYLLEMGFDPHYMSDATFLNRLIRNNHDHDIHAVSIESLYFPMLINVRAQFESGNLFVRVEGFAQNVAQQNYFPFPEFHKKAQGTHFLIKNVTYKEELR